MIKTLEGIGASYRRKANAMLDEVERILPQIGIHHFMRSVHRCRIQARILLRDGQARKVVFIPHPGADSIEIAACCQKEDSGDVGRYGKAILNLKQIKDLKQAVEKAILVVLLSSNRDRY